MKTIEIFFVIVSMGYSYIFLTVLHKLIGHISDQQVRKFWLIQAVIIFWRQIWVTGVVAFDGLDVSSIGHSVITIILMSWQMYYLNKRYSNVN